MKLVIAYISAAAVFLALDFLWLGYIARDFFQSRLSDILLDQPKLGVAAGFYLLFCVGLIYFAVMPALQKQDWTLALLNGALFGFFTYLTYDATNLATLKAWKVEILLADTGWGTILSAVSALAGYLAGRLWERL